MLLRISLENMRHRIGNGSQQKHSQNKQIIQAQRLRSQNCVGGAITMPQTKTNGDTSLALWLNKTSWLAHSRKSKLNRRRIPCTRIHLRWRFFFGSPKIPYAQLTQIKFSHRGFFLNPLCFDWGIVLETDLGCSFAAAPERRARCISICATMAYMTRARAQVNKSKKCRHSGGGKCKLAFIQAKQRMYVRNGGRADGEE